MLVYDVNLLAWDETTNFMDIPYAEATETVLCEYEGTLLFVSYDVGPIENIAMIIVKVEDGK